LVQRPFTCIAPIGNAESIISGPRNTEKIFEFYPDFLTSSNDRKFGESFNSIDDRQVTSLLPRWSTSPMNPLWGNITHSPNLVTTRRLALNNSKSPQSDRHVSFNSPEIVEKQKNCHAPNIDRGILVRNLSNCDQSNLSPTMQRALRVMRIHSAGRSPADGFHSPRPSENMSTDLSCFAEEASPGAGCSDSSWIGTMERNDSDVEESVDGCAEAHVSPMVKSGSALAAELNSSCLESISNYRSHPMTPTCLDGEFVAMKDTLDPSGGVRVRIRNSSSMSNTNEY
jgi:hypothetical protein